MIFITLISFLSSSPSKTPFTFTPPTSRQLATKKTFFTPYEGSGLVDIGTTTPWRFRGSEASRVFFSACWCGGCPHLRIESLMLGLLVGDIKIICFTPYGFCGGLEIKDVVQLRYLEDHPILLLWLTTIGPWWLFSPLNRDCLVINGWQPPLTNYCWWLRNPANQFRLLVYPRWFAAFLNHQQ